MNVTIAVADTGMDEDDDGEHADPSRHTGDNGDNNILIMENDAEPKSKRTRNGEDEPTYYSRAWWQVLQRKDDLRDPTSILGLKFRVRFRLPFVLFEHMMVKVWEWFPCREKDIVGRLTAHVD